MTGDSDSRKRSLRARPTRKRLIEAAIMLHSRGLATYAEIARQAGVTRATVRRHFPDEVDLVAACTAEYDRSHPLPEPDSWKVVRDGVGRLRVALTDLYGYYAENEAFQATGRLGLTLQPNLYPSFAHYIEVGRRSHRVIADAWGCRPADGSATSAAIGHAIEFETWRSLHHEQGLTSSQSVELMVSLVQSAALAEDSTARRNLSTETD